MSESKKLSNNKITYFKFRCTEYEKNLLTQKAKEAGYKKVSDYVRDRTLRDTQIVLAASGFIRKLTTLNGEVGKIGVNINQVIKAINISIKPNGLIGDKNAKDLSVLIREYNLVLEGLGKEIKNLLRHGRKKEIIN